MTENWSKKLKVRAINPTKLARLDSLLWQYLVRFYIFILHCDIPFL